MVGVLLQDEGRAERSSGVNLEDFPSSVEGATSAMICHLLCHRMPLCHCATVLKKLLITLTLDTVENALPLVVGCSIDECNKLLTLYVLTSLLWVVVVSGWLVPGLYALILVISVQGCPRLSLADCTS